MYLSNETFTKLNVTTDVVKYHKADSNFQRITLPNEGCSINKREMLKFAATPEKSSDAANEAMKNRAVFRSE